MAKQGKAAQHKLDLSEAKCDTLRTTIDGLNTSLDDARSEIKTLNTKLVAARNAEAASRAPPGSVLKSTTAASRQASSEAVHAAQAKEDLYTDLTGLIVRGFKQEGEDDVFDCIQTGRNGSKFALTWQARPGICGRCMLIQVTSFALQTCCR